MNPRILAQRSRRLEDTSFVASGLQSLKIPLDHTMRHLLLRLNGAVQTTFAAGSPAAPRESSFDTLIPRVDFTLNGGTAIKAQRPHMLRMQEFLANKQEAERRSSAGAAAATDNLPTVEGGFVWGTTTQYSTIAETVRMSMEHTLSTKGGEQTRLNLRKFASAEVKFTMAAFSALDTSGATVTYANSTLVIQAFTIEDKSTPESQDFAFWKQTVRTENITAQLASKQYDLQTRNFLSGIALYVKNGASPSVPTDIGLTDIRLLLNGTDLIRAGTFKSFQNEMKQRFGVNAPVSSNVSRLDGYVYIDLLDQGDLNTALDCRKADSVILELSTSANATYSLALQIEPHEIINPRAAG